VPLKRVFARVRRSNPGADDQAADVAARDTLTATLAANEQEYAALKKQLEDTLARKEKESAGELKRLEETEKELSKQLVKLSAEHSQMTKALNADAALAATTDAEIGKLEAASAAAEQEVEKAHGAAAKAAETAKAAEAAAAEKQAAYEAAMGLGNSASDGAKNLQAQLSDAKDEVSSSESTMKAAEMRQKHLAKELKASEAKLADARKSGGAQEKAHAALSADVAKLCSRGWYSTMPPFKMRDMPEERKQNFIALKQEVKISELIPVLMKEAPETAATTLSRTLDLYEKGQLRGPAAFIMIKNAVGLSNCKAAFEELVPGYKHDHSAFTYEHPIVV